MSCIGTFLLSLSVTPDESSEFCSFTWRWTWGLWRWDRLPGRWRWPPMVPDIELLLNGPALISSASSGASYGRMSPGAPWLWFTVILLLILLVILCFPLLLQSARKVHLSNDYSWLFEGVSSKKIFTTNYFQWFQQKSVSQSFLNYSLHIMTFSCLTDIN